MSKTTKIIIAIATVILLLIAAVILFFGVTDSSVSPTSVPVTNQQENKQPADENLNYTEPEIRKTINDVAKERFGDDAFVIFLSTEGPSEVEIDGIKRTVYIYAADSTSSHDKTGEVRGLYHVDAVTGEIFDNGSGTMEKVIIGE